MTKKTITYEVKLQPSVIIILVLLAVGVCANALAPVFSIKDAFASIVGDYYNPVYIVCKDGCN